MKLTPKRMNGTEADSNGLKSTNTPKAVINNVKNNFVW